MRGALISFLFLAMALNYSFAQVHPVFTQTKDANGTVHQTYIYVHDARPSQPGNASNGNNKNASVPAAWNTGTKPVSEKDNYLNPNGVLLYKDGAKYIGTWQNYARSGYGKMYDAKGSLVSEGYWEDDKYLGKPVNNVPFKYGGGTYIGTWTGDKLTGHCKIQFDGGSKYEGDLVEGIYEGQGTYMWSNGIQQHSGQWHKGKLNGKGRYVDAAGNTYEGDFIDDDPDGVGTMKWITGDTYTGKWAKGSRNGKGVYTLADGNKLDGIWEDNKLVGSGTNRYANIMDAITENDVPAVKDFINAKYDLNKTIEYYKNYQNVFRQKFNGYTGPPLGYAIASSRILDNLRTEIVNLLINAGADVNGVDVNGYTPLMLAINNSQFPYMETLLAHGADKKIKAKDGMTVLKLAKQRADEFKTDIFKGWVKELKK